MTDLGCTESASPCVIIPVIHYADDAQVMRNAERAFDAGCAGVMLIEMRGRNRDLPFAAAQVAMRWPDRLVGLNLLGLSVATDICFAAYDRIAATWTDEQLTHSGAAPWLDARRTRKALDARPGHLLFCAVAFKYQPHEPDAALAARTAVDFGFIPTISGPSTGAAADPSFVASLRENLGAYAPLAIASGLTPENAPDFLPHVSHILVSSGVSSSFHEFDPARLRALTEARDAYSRSHGLRGNRP